MKTPKWGMVAVVLFMALAMLLMVVPAGASPGDFACNFYGTATVDGTPVADGTGISAWFGGTPVASTVTGAGSLADNEYAFNVTLDEVNEGATINFKIGALWASETGTWQKLQFVPVNLTATTPNNPPNMPSNPSPADGATGVPIDANLSWTGGDPDVGDTVTYDVYFGTSTTPPLVSNDQPATTYDPGTLSDDTQYYWKIVAADNHGASTDGPLWDFTTIDLTPPTVISTLPANDASGVWVVTAVTATFSEDIQAGANFAGIAISGATGVSATIVGDTLTIAHDVFAYETLYEVTIPAGAVNDLADNPLPLAAPYTWSFTTGAVPPVWPPPVGPPDTTRPTVVSTSPVNGAADVAVGTAVTATFSEFVIQGTIVFSLDSVSGSVSYAGATATFDPTADLDYSTTYTASIRATDRDGNRMAAPYTWSFTTTEGAPEEEAPPVVPVKPVLGPRLSVSNLRISPDQVYPNQPVTIYVKVVNAGDRSSSKMVDLMINGELEQNTHVGVGPHTAKDISFTVYRATPGQYSVFIEGVTGWFVVGQLEVTPSVPLDEGLGTGDVIAIVVIGIIVIFGIIFIFLYTRRSA